MTNDERNVDEEAARGRKVLALLAVIPTGASSDENRIIAEFLIGLSIAERAIFAKLAKVNAPSGETWTRVIEAVRTRKPIGEVVS